MVEETLVDPRIREGREVLEALLASNFPVEASYWLRRSDEVRFDLIVSTELYDKQGPRRCYREIDRILESAALSETLAAESVSVVSGEDDISLALRSVLLPQGTFRDERLKDTSINGVYIPDAYIYFARPLSEFRSKKTSPVDNGLFRGDLTYDDFVDVLQRNNCLQNAALAAVRNGFKEYLEGSDHSWFRNEHYRSRLYHAVVRSGIRYRSDLEETLAIDSDAEFRLKEISAFARNRGVNLIAVPEDVLTLLIISRKRANFSERAIERLAFRHDITESLKLYHSSKKKTLPA